MQFKKLSLAAALAVSVLSPAFAQASDPCVVATQIDASTQKFTGTSRDYIANITRTKRIVDYRSELVTMQTTVSTTHANGGSAAALQTKSFTELSKDAADALKRQKPAGCQL